MLSGRQSTKVLSTVQTPRHLWSSDPDVVKIRRSLILHWIRSSISLWILTLLIAMIYLGSGVNPNWHTQSLGVYINDFDNGLAGDFFLNAFHNTPAGNLTLNWIFLESTSLPSSMIQSVENGEVWASVYINTNTSDYLNGIIQSILGGNMSTVTYSPTSAVTIVYDEGRNFNSINGYVLPPIRAAIAVASADYAAYIQSQVTASSNVNLSNVLRSIALINITDSPISYTTLNLHPAVPYASLLSTSLGYLFLWLIMLSLVGMAIRLTQPLVIQVRILDIALIRIFNTILNGLVISLLYSLCVLWFASFTRPVPFIRFWLFNWLAAITFTSIIALFTINLGALAQMFLTLFLVTNLATSTTNVDIELQNRFYRVGYGLPLYHCFHAGRHFLFGSHTNLHVDIGVLFAYYFCSVTLVILSGVYRMRKQQQQLNSKTTPTTKK